MSVSSAYCTHTTELTLCLPASAIGGTLGDGDGGDGDDGSDGDLVCNKVIGGGKKAGHRDSGH